MAAARRQRFWLRSAFSARRVRPHLRRDDRGGKAWIAAEGPGAVASRPGIYQACRCLPCERVSLLPIVTSLINCCSRPRCALAAMPAGAYDAYHELNNALCRLRTLAILPLEMPLLRFQQPRPARRHRRSPICQGLRDRNCYDSCARARPRCVEHFFRRRDPVTDAALVGTANS